MTFSILHLGIIGKGPFWILEMNYRKMTILNFTRELLEKDHFEFYKEMIGKGLFWILQRNQTDLQNQDRGCGLGKVKRATGKTWGPCSTWFGHVEHSSNAVRTAYDIQFDGRQAGGREAQANIEETDGRKTVVSGSSWQLTLNKGAPGDQVWDLLCVQLASYLEGAHWCGWCPCILIKNWLWWWEPWYLTLHKVRTPSSLAILLRALKTLV